MKVVIFRIFYVYIPEGNYYSENLINDINTIFSDKGVPLEVIFYLDYNNAGGIGNGNRKLTIGGATDNTTVTVNEIELNFSGKRIGATEEILIIHNLSLFMIEIF